MNQQIELSTNQIEKIKKQSKKLLKFAKENEGIIPINNLAAAQELLSKLNGFQDWHSLTQNKKIIKEVSKLTNEIYSEVIFNPNEQNEKVVSIFKIKSIQHNFNFQHFMQQINFYLNTGFHNISVNIKSNTYQNLASTAYEEYIQSLPIDKTIADSLFKIDLEEADSKIVDIYVCLSTNKDMDYMHLDLCNLFKKNIHGSFISDVDTQYKINMNLHSENTLLSVNEDFQKDITKWLDFLNYIIFQETDINIDLNLKGNDIQAIVKYEFNKSEEYINNRKKLYSGLYNAVLKSEQKTLQAPSFIQNNIQPIILENGIPVLDYGSNRFNLIPVNVKSGLVYGKPGSGNNTLFQSIIINKIFTHYKKFNELPTLNIITTHHESILKLLNNIYPEHSEDISVTELNEHVNFFIKLNKEDNNTYFIKMMAQQLNLFLNIDTIDIVSILKNSIHDLYESVNYDSIPTLEQFFIILKSINDLNVKYQNQTIFKYIVQKFNEYRINSNPNLKKAKINIINVNKIIKTSDNEFNALLLSSVINNCNLNADFIINDYQYFSKIMDSFFNYDYFKSNINLISQQEFSYGLISRSDFYIAMQDIREGNNLSFGPTKDSFLINYQCKGYKNKIVNLIIPNYHNK